MGIRFLFGIALFIFVSFKSFAVDDSKSSHSVRFIADEWYPFNGQPNGAKPGFMIELAERIVEPNGWHLEYRLASWDKAIELVNQGLYDCVVGAYKEEVPHFIFPNIPWALDQDGFYGLTDYAWEFKALSDLENQRIGLISSYSYGKEIDEWLAAHPEQLDWLDGNDALDLHIQKLLHKRLDLILESITVMKTKLSAMHLVHKVSLLSRYSVPDEVYVACSPDPKVKDKSKALTVMFDEGYKALQASGELEQLQQRYGVMIVE